MNIKEFESWIDNLSANDMVTGDINGYDCKVHRHSMISSGYKITLEVEQFIVVMNVTYLYSGTNKEEFLDVEDYIIKVKENEQELQEASG